jgi:hypothetical protein
MSNPRSVRYRRLALAEPDPEKARVLQRIADEAEQGVLFTADWLTPAKYMGEPPKVT